MNEYAGINVRLSRTEFERLSATAQRELRHPRDQARYLLRLALGLVDHPHENANPDRLSVAPSRLLGDTATPVRDETLEMVTRLAAHLGLDVAEEAEANNA